MATTINNYSVGLHLDASSYIKNSDLSRKETTALTRSLNQARTPADRYRRQVDLLDKAVKKGAIDQRIYNKLLDDAKNKFNITGKSAGFFSTQIGKIGKAMAGMAAATATLATVRSAWDSLRQTMLDVDAVAKQSRAIGVSYNQLRAFQMAAGEFAGVSGPQAGEMLAKLARRAGDAANGLGEGAKAFQMLGLSVDSIRGKSPIELFEMVANKIAAIEDPTIRASVAAKLFEAEGKKLLPMLTEGGGVIEDYIKKLKAFGLAMDENAIAKIELANDNFERLTATFEGLKLTLLAAPELMNAMVTSIQAMEGAVIMLNYSLKRLLVAYEKLGWTPGGLSGDGSGMGLAGRQGKPQMRPMGPNTGDFYTPMEPRTNLAFDSGQFTQPILGGLQSFAAGMMGGFQQVGGAIIANATMNTEKSIKATTENKAVKSLEAGTQEAYSFLISQENDRMQADKAKEARARKAQEEANAIGEEGNRLLSSLVDWAAENGFGAIR